MVSPHTINRQLSEWIKCWLSKLIETWCKFKDMYFNSRIICTSCLEFSSHAVELTLRFVSFPFVVSNMFLFALMKGYDPSPLTEYTHYHYYTISRYSMKWWVASFHPSLRGSQTSSLKWVPRFHCSPRFLYCGYFSQQEPGFSVNFITVIGTLSMTSKQELSARLTIHCMPKLHSHFGDNQENKLGLLFTYL